MICRFCDVSIGSLNPAMMYWLFHDSSKHAVPVGIDMETFLSTPIQMYNNFGLIIPDKPV